MQGSIVKKKNPPVECSGTGRIWDRSWEFSFHKNVLLSWAGHGLMDLWDYSTEEALLSTPEEMSWQWTGRNELTVDS